MKRAPKLVVPERTFFNKPQQDNVFLPNEKIVLSDYFKDPNGNSPIMRKGLECGIISNGKLVNIVSDGYGHLPNEKFFIEVEQKLEEANIRYTTRSINRDDVSFAVDYILADDSFHTTVKKAGAKTDIIRPALRFINYYAGGQASGYVSFWRELCSNSLHLGTQTDIGFKVRHSGNIVELVLPKIGEILTNFMDNEYYSINKKFEVLAERPILDLKNFVKVTANDLNIFQYEKSEKNPEPSATAELVLNTIREEARYMGTDPTFWHGYNAFNEVIGTKMKKSFDVTRNIDGKIFDYVYAMATAQ